MKTTPSNYMILPLYIGATKSAKNITEYQFGFTSISALENVPFVINVRTAPGEGDRLATFTGFSLDYKQIPC